METRARNDVEYAARQLRELLVLGGRLRPDDVDELCDHYCSSVDELIREGHSPAGAIEEARNRLGPVGDLIDEMTRVRRPPRFFRRWCSYLIGATVGLSSWTILQMVVVLVRAALYTDVPERSSASVVVSLLGCSIGLGLILRIAFRFGFFGSARMTRTAASGIVPFLYIGGLGITLLCGVILIDYWEWWIAAVNARGMSPPWDSAFMAIAFFVVGPVAALTGATLLARWHPALAPVGGEAG